MRIGIFGTGYVGLVTAVGFSKLGHTVVALDKQPDVVARLSRGIPTFYEPGLTELLTDNLATGRLTFTTSAEAAVGFSDLIFVCVGTPPQADGSTDLSQVAEVVSQLASCLKGHALIVEKSTVPINTAACIDRAIRQLTGPEVDCQVPSNPEFLREGSALQDFLHPDRIVIGVDSERARATLLELYRPDFHCPILVTSVKMAELIKHAANAFLATKISFINMVADLCEKVDGDVSVVAEGMGLDHRIGRHFLNAGLGFGGSCFPKDLKAFVCIAEDRGVDFALLREVERINRGRVDHLLRLLDRAFWVTHSKVVAVWGGAFKPNTDDIREAPSLRVIPQLLEWGACVRIYDPQAAGRLRQMCPPGDRLSYSESAYDAAAGAHGIVILTDWDEFRAIDWSRLRGLMRTPLIVDGRNLLDPGEMQARGFDYYSLGRGHRTAGRLAPSLLPA